jgi:hypothetical protein
MLPSKLMYNNKIASAYARNFTSVIDAQNTSEYSVGQTAIINLPTMNNQFLSGADSVLSLTLKLRARRRQPTLSSQPMRYCWCYPTPPYLPRKQFAHGFG